MDSQKVKSVLMVLHGTNKFTKSFLENKRDLTEAEIAYLIDEEYLVPCGTNTVNEKLFCVSKKGDAFWRS